MKPLHVSVVIILILHSICSAIITRDDRQDQQYIDHARRSEFASFCFFADGAGTLIADRWVLTARHVAVELAISDSVFFLSDTVLIENIVSFPRLSARTPDISLVRIDRRPDGATIAGLLSRLPDKDAVIHMIGRGDYGTGLSGPLRWDKIIRGATNRIDQVSERHISFAFDSPQSPRVTDLEGISGPGDSGGPAYIWQAGNVWLAGVSSAQNTGPVGKEGIYGVTEYYVNVYSYLWWIRETVNGKYFVMFEEGGDRFNALVNNGTVESITQNGEELDDAEIAGLRPKVLDLYRQQKLSASTLPMRERMPAFLAFINQLAKEAGITESLRPVSFDISDDSLLIEGKTVDKQWLEKAHNRYREIFGKPLQGGFNFEVE